MAQHEGSYGLIRNIPSPLHSEDLRLFFKDYIVEEHFAVFHYLHRRESSVLPISSGSKQDTRCCLVRLRDSVSLADFIARYAGKTWVGVKGPLDTPCRILPVRVSRESPSDSVSPSNSQSLPTDPYQQFWTRRHNITQRRQKSSEIDIRATVQGGHLLCDPAKWGECNPPLGLPRGNVGTPRHVIMANVNRCVLPARILGKLGVHDLPAEHKPKRYGKVPFEYEPGVPGVPSVPAQGEQDVMNVSGLSSHVPTHPCMPSPEPTHESLNLPTPPPTPPPTPTHTDTPTPTPTHTPLPPPRPVPRPKMPKPTLRAEMDPHPDTGEPEEWDRYLAQQRYFHREPSFEDPMEVTWDKGSSGLVFYTDELHWRNPDDHEERIDELDLFDLETDVPLDASLAHSAPRFKFRTGALRTRTDTPADPIAALEREQPPRSHDASFRVDEGEISELPVGAFERHTRGVGSHLLKTQGWRPGSGVGLPSRRGRELPLPLSAHTGKRGIGYVKPPSGPRERDRWVRGAVGLIQKRREPKHLISTVYDRPEDVWFSKQGQREKRRPAEVMVGPATANPTRRVRFRKDQEEDDQQENT